MESPERPRLICTRSIAMHIHTRLSLTLRLRSVLQTRLPTIVYRLLQVLQMLDPPRCS
jgi:hypothetical protein